MDNKKQNTKKVNRRAFTSAYLILTENCNLRCTYCFEGGTRCIEKYMSKEVAFKTVDYLLSQAIENDVDSISITFFGGEPTICPELMTDIMNYTETKAREANIKTKYSIITNGTIFNEKLEVFFDTWRSYKDNKIDVQLSIDGLPEIQDKKRPCAITNLSSSKLVEETVTKYKEYYAKHNIDLDRLHIHACVSKESLPRIYDSFMYFTKTLGILNSKFAWVIEDDWDDNDLNIFSEEMYKMIKRLADTTTNLERFPFKHFTKCSGCSVGQNLMCVDTDGNIYPCHRFFFNNIKNRQSVILGNVFDKVIDTKRRNQYINLDYTKMAPEACQICIATNHACKGDIHKLANDYSYKFMNIINQYYNSFEDLIDKKKTAKLMQDMVYYLNQKDTEIKLLKNHIAQLENKENNPISYGG